MLTNIDPLLTPELLQVLAEMGHGDEIAVVDANFPAYSVARATSHGQVLAQPGALLPAVVGAILSLVPLDQYVDAPVRRMASPDDELPEVQQEIQTLIDAIEARHLPVGDVERFAFYEAARSAYAVVLTGERRLYGNVLIKKGVVAPS